MQIDHIMSQFKTVLTTKNQFGNCLTKDVCCSLSTLSTSYRGRLKVRFILGNVTVNKHETIMKSSYK